MPREIRAPGTNQFPCRQCGALQTYTPGTEVLTCPYCGYESRIASDVTPQIREYDFREALDRLADAPPAETRTTTQCETCAAEFDFDKYIHAGQCPFCGTPIVQGTGRDRHIKPESLLPFSIDERAATERFRAWLGKLWLAPGKLKSHADGDSRLTGVYVPYWTYDSDTVTRYRGQRGDAYYVPVRYATVVNGRRVMRTRRERRIRWTPVAGTVRRYFDDVLVGASHSLPRKIADRLAPWGLEDLVPYDDRYLSGFAAEAYQVDLDEGFNDAAAIMDRMIRRDVALDIGGDAQRVTALDTRHSRTTFKHVLLPVWSAAFRFRDQLYRFVVNGRTGKVDGERPFSKPKIAGLILLGILVVVVVVVVSGGR